MRGAEYGTKEMAKEAGDTGLGLRLGWAPPRAHFTAHVCVCGRFPGRPGSSVALSGGPEAQDWDKYGHSARWDATQACPALAGTVAARITPWSPGLPPAGPVEHGAPILKAGFSPL